MGYFPKNYGDSRKEFQKRVETLNAPKEIDSWRIPSKEDDDLFVDSVWLPPSKTAKTLLVITSGIHGAETYAGAAIQLMFLDEIFPQIDRKNIGVYIVHCMNPYGFKYHERCTENGVNLNRNFSVSGANYKLRNEESSRLCERFLVRKPVQSLTSSLISKMTKKNGKPYFDDISLDTFIKGISPGQYDTPENLEFGGYGPEPQTQKLIHKLSQLMPQFQNVVGLDLHTGLGAPNRLHLLTDGKGPSLNSDLFSQIFRADEDSEFYEYTPPETEGFYPVHGAQNSAFGELAHANQRVCSITMEFGTLGHSLEQQLEGLNSFIVHHQGKFHGYVDKELEKQVKQANFERSRPASKEWEKQVIRASRGLFERLLQRL